MGLHIDGQFLNAFNERRGIPWGVFYCQIPPALERAAGLWDGLHDLRVKDDAAAANAVLADDLVKADDFLAGQNVTFNHPINRATVQKFVLPSGPHAGDVAGFTTALQHMLCLPCGLCGHAFGTNAEFYKV